jgi:hypothetical protein
MDGVGRRFVIPPTAVLHGQLIVGYYYNYNYYYYYYY